MSRRRRHRGPSRPRCRNCRADVLFFRDWTGRKRIVNARPVDGREQHRGAFPVWGGRLWETAEDLAAELSTIRPAGTDFVDEAYDLPWHTLHHCQITEKIAEATREAHA